jgi:O-acetyl-ADP-ribose deacetylase (regulator of RNase III)
MRARSLARWTNSSVLAFAGGEDPIGAITEQARALVLKALDDGWQGPPFDPIQLADLLGLTVVPSDDVKDARAVPMGRHAVRIEFNPNRPRGRMRYSLAHEIAHTLFKDCAERVRNRVAHEQTEGDEWQLEALCNIAAAEFLMPFGATAELTAAIGDIDLLLAEQRRFDVSMEALLIRAVRVAAEPCSMFCCSRSDSGRYRLDYQIAGFAWKRSLVAAGTELPPDGSAVGQCTAIGFTAKGDETWGKVGDVHVECIGIPPYPGSRYPRVVGIVRQARDIDELPASAITLLRGDATVPRGAGRKLIVHIVNDATANWGGGGFAVAVRRAFPEVQDAFKEWAADSRGHLRLGAAHLAQATEDTWVASLVAQKGYGHSAKPRIRYAALREGLEVASKMAAELGASVHMPRLGCGQAGGTWDVVEELVRAAFVTAGRPVTVYDPPSATAPAEPAQQRLKL